MWILFVLFSLILLGIIVVAMTHYDLPVLGLMDKNNNVYFPYHIVLSCFSAFLGDYGKQLRQRSFARLLASENITYTPAIGILKKELFSELILRSDGGMTVLEAGAGPGVNFEYYPKRCDVIIVEPVADFKDSIMNELMKHEGIRLKQFIQAGVENVHEVADGSVDVVISSDLLCSVKDARQVIREIHRILKPNGKYYFSEHTLGNRETWRRKLQDFLMWTDWWPMWMMGCKFIDISALFRNTDFTDVKGQAVELPLKEFAASVNMIAPHYLGVATK